MGLFELRKLTKIIGKAGKVQVPFTVPVAVQVIPYPLAHTA